MCIKTFVGVIFSSINWSTHWQIHHQLVNSIVLSGDKVLFVENTGVRSPQIKDFGRILERVKARLSSIHGFKDVESSVTVFTPVFIPYPYNKLSIFLNTLLIYRSIRGWIKVVKFYEPICISFLPTPAVQEIIRNIDPSLKIYYCACVCMYFLIRATLGDFVLLTTFSNFPNLTSTF